MGFGKGLVTCILKIIKVMAAPKENQFWKFRSIHGRDKLFSTPEDGEVKASSFQVVSINDKPATNEEMAEALKCEFSLPLPKGKRWDLERDLLPAYLKSLK